MRPPKTLTSVAILVAITWMALPVEAQSTTAVPSSSADPAPPNPMASARGVRSLLRNGQDYLAFGEYDRALEFLREAEARKAELTPAERQTLQEALQKAKQHVGASASATATAAAPASSEASPRRRASALAATSTPKIPSLAQIELTNGTADPEVARTQAEVANPLASASDRVALPPAPPALPPLPDEAPKPLPDQATIPASADVPASGPPTLGALDVDPLTPTAMPAASEPAATTAPVRVAPEPAITAPAELPKLPAAVEPVTPQPVADVPVELPSSAPADPQPAATEPTAPVLTELPSSALANPELVAPPTAPAAPGEVSSAPANPELVVPPAAPAAPGEVSSAPANPELVIPPAAPAASPTVPSPPVDPSPAGPEPVAAAAPSEAPSAAVTPSEAPSPAPTGGLAIRAEEKPARTSEALPPLPADAPLPPPAEDISAPAPPPAISQPAAPHHEEPSAPAAAAASAPSGSMTLPPLPPEAAEGSAEAAPPSSPSPSTSRDPVYRFVEGSARPEVTLPPELRREVEEVARAYQDELQQRRNGNGTNAQPTASSSGTGLIAPIMEPGEPTTSESRIELPRVPSPTEPRPIRSIPVPEEYVSLQPRKWAPTRKLWAAAGTCHTPLYFQDAPLERYGEGVEQALGPMGRFASIPLDDPTQSNQRQQILQPFWSVTKFGVQIVLWPFNMVMNPPWEAEYDLGYYRPGDKVPPDTFYWPMLGVGPPLHGMRY